MKRSTLFALSLSLCGMIGVASIIHSAFATVPTVNPAVPAENSVRTSLQMRQQFQAIFNDETNLYGLTIPFGTSNAGVVPQTSGVDSTHFLNAVGGWAVPAGGGGLTSIGSASLLANIGTSSAVPVGTSISNITPYVYGLSRWQTALSNVRNGTGNAIVCAIGDSTTFGYLGSSPSIGSGPSYSWPYQLATIATTDYGLLASANSWMGAASPGGASGAWGNGSVAGITAGSGWSVDSATFGMGYQTYTASGTTSSFAFTPQNSVTNSASTSGQVDTFVFFYVIDSGLGVLAANIDGGSNTTYNTSGAAAVGVATLTAGSVGSHTLNLNWSSGGQVNIIGAYAYNSTIKQVIVINAGSSGELSTQAALATKPYNPGNPAMFSALGCNLTLFNLGINDQTGGTSAANYKIAMQSLITAAETVGDVVLETPIPANPGVFGIGTNAAQYAYYYNLYAVANQNKIPLIDNFLRWGSYAYANQFNTYADVYVHPRRFGHLDIARAVAKLAFGQPTQNWDETNKTFMNGNNAYGIPDVFINVTDNVGIGTTLPANKIDINGSASIGYQNTTAPTNGLIVSGSVGIGTSTASVPLTIKGGAAVVPAALTITAGSATPNMLASNYFYATLGVGTTTINAPTNPVDGQHLRLELVQPSGGNGTVTWLSSTGGYDMGVTGAPTLSIGTGKLDNVGFTYSLRNSKFNLDGTGLGN